MHRIAAKHRFKGRSMADLDERQLVNLPVPVPSIPVINPLVTPLVGGPASSSSSPSNPQSSPPSNPQPTSPSSPQPSSPSNPSQPSSPSNPPPASSPSNPQPTSSASSGGNGGGSSGSGNGNGNGNNGGNGNGNGNGNNGNGNGNGGGNGSNGSSGASGATPSPTPDSGSSNGSSSSPPGPPSSPASSFSDGSSSTSGGSNSASSPSPSSSIPGPGPQSAPVNVGGAPPSTSATSAGAASMSPSGSSVLVAPVPSATGHTITGTTGPAVASPTVTDGAAVSTHKQLSSGAIAGITVVCLLFLLGLILLFVRRRSIAQRSERRNRWWFGRYGASGSLHALGRHGSNGSDVMAGTTRMSARSSFATNFDQGLMFRIDSPTPQFDRHALGVVPEFPPTAEVRERNGFLMATGGAVARRQSLNSMVSNGSDSDTQYLLVPSAAEPGPLTPMSVRPFSPSESFVFPKPPTQQGSDTAGHGQPFSPPYTPAGSARVSPQSSAATLVHANTANNADPAILAPTTMAAPSISPIAAADPFADPAKPEFADVETIRRPFAPNLDDELPVVPGDKVRIMQVFDDGWAFVEKLRSDTLPERGLIPVDCLREAGQALPTFLAQKRVSSYGGSDVDGNPVLQNALEHGYTATAF